MKDIAMVINLILSEWILSCVDLPGTITAKTGSPELTTSDGHSRRMVSVEIVYEDAPLASNGPHRAVYLHRVENLKTRIQGWGYFYNEASRTPAGSNLVRALKIWEDVTEESVEQFKRSVSLSA